MEQVKIKYNGFPEKINLNTSYFFGTRLDNIDKAAALQIINGFLNQAKSNRTNKIYFTNVHTIHIARKNPHFNTVVNNADLVLPDGSGLKIAGWLLSKRIKANLNGTDFLPIVLKYSEETGRKVYFLGASREVLTKCIKKVRFQFPELKIVGCHSGYFEKDDEPLIVQDINDSSPDILLVAMGSPVQELFINNYADQLNVAVSFAVGGLFDFLSGDKKRAPEWLRRTGLEWLYRFFQDPKTKWNRIVVEIPVFLTLVLFKRFLPQNNFAILNKKFG